MEQRSLIIAQAPQLSDKLISMVGRRDHDVHTALCFLDGLELAVNVKCNFIIMELYPPWQNALQPLMVIRRCNPAVLVTLMHPGDEVDRTRCLNYADAFAWLPAKPARLKATLLEGLENRKRDPNPVTTPHMYCRGLILFTSHQRVFYGYNEFVFSPTEYSLLHHLMLNRDIVLSRDALIQEVWGYDFAGNTNTVNTHVQKLRAKLAEKTDKVYIETVQRFGYRFVSENPTLFSKMIRA